MVDRVAAVVDQPLPASVTAALQAVPRHEFIEDAYEPGGDEIAGSRVLAPRTVARLVAALDTGEGDETLIVGAGVGYTAAVVAEQVGGRHVHAVDIDRNLVHIARENLANAGYDTVLVDCRDGAGGLPEYAPFDRILVESAVVSPPAALLEQLTPAGRIVFPQGMSEQRLVAARGSADEITERDSFGRSEFRPLLVEGEQPSSRERNRTRREDAEFDSQGYFAKSGWEYEWLDWDERLDSR